MEHVFAKSQYFYQDSRHPLDLILLYGFSSEILSSFLTFLRGMRFAKVLFEANHLSIIKSGCNLPLPANRTWSTLTPDSPASVTSTFLTHRHNARRLLRYIHRSDCHRTSRAILHHSSDRDVRPRAKCVAELLFHLLSKGQNFT